MTPNDPPASADDHLYPPIEPYATERLDVGHGHTLYVEQSGNPDSTPVVFLHGGPGGGSSPRHRRFFDPAAYRIVVFDQRGCGRSTPHASVEHNTTWDLVADIERIREHLGIERWQVFGGSWGSTLALAYAQRHAARVTALVLRGIFLLRPAEIDFFYQEGTSFLFPDAWEEYVAPIPPDERGDLVAAHHRRLFGDDEAARRASARAWARWESATSMLRPDGHAQDDDEMLAMACIENHYFTHGGFFDDPDELLHGVEAIRDVPAVIVQGRYDCVCPMRTAWDLHRAWPEAELIVCDRAGHSAFDPQITATLVAATDRFRGLATR